MTAGLEAEHCAKCEKVVYEAEGLPAGNSNCSQKFCIYIWSLEITNSIRKLIEINVDIFLHRRRKIPQKMYEMRNL